MGNHLSNSCRWRRDAKYHVQVLLFPCQPVSWSGVLVGIISFVNCQPLLIYVLRWHMVPVPPAPSPPPALLCSRASVPQNPLLQSLLVVQNNSFSLTSLPHRLLLAPGPLCQIGLFPRSSLAGLHLPPVPSLESSAAMAPGPLVPLSTRLPSSPTPMLTAPDLSAWASGGCCGWLGCAAPWLSVTLPLLPLEAALSICICLSKLFFQEGKSSTGFQGTLF